MNQEILRIKSIRQLHSFFGLMPPKHPLVTILDVSKWEISEEFIGKKVISDLYSIALKDTNCGLFYGRSPYDFNEGVLIFTAPNQVQAILKSQQLNEIRGWMIIFHPDLIRNTPLATNIENYPFFSYDINEALHLSISEQDSVTKIINMIKNEIDEYDDENSELIISNMLELFLNLSKRYYERQFSTRQQQHTNILSQFNILLKDYYEEGMFMKVGQPTIEYFASRLSISTNYFSELIRKETGTAAKDYLSEYILEKAKILLLSNNEPISKVSYILGFNYPHYFSRFFKHKTGLTPKEYRQVQ